MVLPHRNSKSSRHSKITGDFGEALVLYWLSKHGFECVSVDHTGIDLLARNKHTSEIMGISVKSRSRDSDHESEFVSISRDNFEKAKNACRDFHCVPYFAIVVDAGGIIRVFVLPMSHLQRKYFPTGGATCAWKMTAKWREQYERDPKILIIEFQTKPTTRIVRWFDRCVR